MILMTKVNTKDGQVMPIHKSTLIRDREFVVTLDNGCNILDVVELSKTVNVEVDNAKYIVVVRDNSTKDVCVWEISDCTVKTKRGNVWMQPVGSIGLPIPVDELISNVQARLLKLTAC